MEQTQCSPGGVSPQLDGAAACPVCALCGIVSASDVVSPAVTRPPILDKLEHVRHSGSGWMAKCPAHDDNTPSLSIAWSREREGMTLLHCFAGCEPEAIASAVDMTMQSLMPPSEKEIVPLRRRYEHAKAEAAGEPDPAILVLRAAQAATGARFLQGDPEEPKFIVRPYLPASQFVVLAGAPSAYKSFLGLDLALSIAAGLPWGGTATVRGRTAFITLEDDHATVKARVRAWVAVAQSPAEHELRKAALLDLLPLTREGTRDLHLTETAYGGTVVRREAVDRLVDLLDGRSLAFLETLSRLHRGPETNDPLARFSDAIEEVVTRTGCTIVLGHHFGQETARAGTADMFAPRGGTSLPSASRGVLCAIRDDDQNLSPVRLIHAKPPPNAGRGPDLVFRPRFVKEEYALVMEPVLAEEALKDDAETLYQFILCAGSDGRVERELSHDGPKGLRGSRRGREALARLIANQSVKKELDGKRNGKRATVYLAASCVSASATVSEGH